MNRPTRKQMETAVEVIEWLESPKQDPEMKSDCATVRTLIEQLLAVGW